MKIYLDMIGCRLNQSEIEVMAREFTAAGHSLVGDPGEADLAVVNTCTVTGPAAADSRKTIRRIARSGVEQIISTGCWSTMYPEQALELSGVTQVVSNLEKDQLVSKVLSLDLNPFEKEPIERVPIPGTRLRTRAFIKVQDGCQHHCTFCVTTVARGDSRSELPDQVIREVQAAYQAGAQEAVLTGVQLGSWGADLELKQSLSDLVGWILDRTGIPRLRLSSIEPWDVSPELIDLLAHDRVARHLHLPLQSGSPAVMRRMARAITPEIYSRLVESIRNKIPGIAITTDILTGFPGETDLEFEQNLEFIREMDFADGHVFSYSAREGTPALNFPDQVPHKIRKERNTRIRNLIAESNQAFRESQMGTRLKVLWEQAERDPNGNWLLTGLTDNYIKVHCLSPEEIWNCFSTAEIIKLSGSGVEGKITSQDQQEIRAGGTA